MWDRCRVTLNYHQLGKYAPSDLKISIFRSACQDVRQHTFKQAPET